MSGKRGCAGVALLLLGVVASGCARVDDARVAEELRALTRSNPSFLERGHRGGPLWKEAAAFYKAREFRPAWIARGAPAAHVDVLLQALASADTHGLDPEDYGLSALKEARQRAAESRWFGARFDAKDVAPTDVRLTYAYLQFASDLERGRVPPRRVHANWIGARKNEDLGARLEQALSANRVGPSLEELAPSHQQYAGLRQAIAQFRDRAANPAATAAERKEASGRLEQIRMTMERWRWMPHDLGARHILVNVPAYQLQVVEDGHAVLSMRVIVGSPETPTPLFSDKMTYMVFSPYWNIPESILREETLPRVVEDPEFLARAGIEVIPASGVPQEPIDPTTIDWTQPDVTKGLRFRQVPGPENALGLVKFIFPNHFSVYLHDTPGDALFRRNARALSHGCVRVEQPVALAEYVLHDQQAWTREKITAAMHGGEEQVVRLKNPIDVHLGYWTAWVQADGSVTFTDDPYGLDARHAHARRARDQQARR